MAKRLFAFVLVLAMLVSLMPQVTVGISAEGTEKAPGASEWCDHTSHEGWTEWTDTTKLPSEAGKYYLSVGVDLTEAWSVAEDIHLCLNGHTIKQTGTSARVAAVTGKLSIYDCATAYNADNEYVGGVITGVGKVTYGHGIRVKRGGELNLYGGRISGNKQSATNYNGGAVYLEADLPNQPGGIFNMYGGELYDNQAKLGGAVYLHGENAATRGTVPAVFNMYGGKIWGNKAGTGTIYGLQDAEINILGGEILENTAENASAIYGQNQVQITIQDATITENTASSTNEKGYGAAVFVTGSGSKVTLKGKPYIYGNNLGNEKIGDIHMQSSSGSDIEQLYVDGVTGGFATVGFYNTGASVTAATEVLSGTTADFPTGAVAFKADAETLKRIGVVDGAFAFVEGHFHEGQQYTEWTGGTMGAGYYYLSKDVELSTALSVSGNTHVCFNGSDIIATKADTRIFGVSKGGELTLEDCSATTDADGNYVAGGLTAKEGLTMTRTYGGLINVNAGGTLNMTGGKIYGVTNTGTDGSPVYLQAATTTNGKAVFNMTGGEISGNTAKEGGAINMAAAPETNADTTNLSELNIDGGRIINNTATTRSGAIEMLLGKVTIKNAKINGNAAPGNSFGAIYITGAQSDVVIEDTEIKNNSAKTVSAVNVASSAKLALKNVTITGNTSTGTTYGAVNLANGNATLKLQGTTVIYDNLSSAGAQQNLHLQKGETIDVDVSGLSAGAKVGVSLLKARIDAGNQMFFSTTGMTSVPSGVTSDNADYKVVVDDQGRLALAEDEGGSVTPPVTEGHTHKLCNDASCTSHGDAVPFEKWTDATTLPTSGNYYLDVDVNLTAAVETTGELNLCLNGHTVKQTTAEKRVLGVKIGTTTSITDCGTTGKLTGGNATFGSAVSVRHASTFNLYGGKITGNASKSEGTVYIQGGKIDATTNQPVAGTFNMYGGEISGNTTNIGGAVSSAAPVGAVTQNPAVNIYGGKITGNTTTGRGSAINASGTATIYIENAEISGNTSGGDGTIYATNGPTLTVKNAKIKDNDAKTGAAFSIYGGTATLDGAVIENNHATGAYSAVHAAVSSTAGVPTVVLKGATVIDNNTNGTNKVPMNLYLRNNVMVDVSGLSDTALIGLTRNSARTQDRVSTAALASADQLARFESDSDEYRVDRDAEGYLVLTAKPITTDHMHKVCNDASCADHEVVPFFKWEKTDSLPTSGNYYLDVDVELTAATTVSGELNLCLNGHTIKQTKAGQRVISVSQDSVLTITDCNAAPGSITGGNNDYGSAIYLNEGADFNLFGGRITGNTPVSENASNTGAAIFLRSASKGGATFNMYGGEISGNGNDYSWGGAVSNGLGNAGKTVYVNIYGGKITGNTAGTGGAIRLSNGAVLTIAGGEITDNTAATGGAVYLVNGAELKLEGGKISGNSADLAGGIYTTAANTVTVSGDAVVMDNTANGKQNNLYLDGDAVITLGAVDADAKVGISVSKVNRAISSQSDTDYTKNFVSDSAYKTITYQDKVLYIAGSSDHKHCVCDSTVSACDHTKQVWTAWESTTSLPTSSGYYYLTEDVTMSAAVTTGTNQEIYLCLNGKTVTSAKRHLIISKGTEYSITDCNAAPGGLTGGKNTYGGSMNVTAGATLNLFAGKIYGNTAPESEGGAVYLQAGQVKSNEEIPGGVFNMYGGEVSGNTAKYGAGIRAAGTNVDGIAPAQVNIYGGVISGNKAVATVTVNATTGKETKSGGSGGAIAATNSTVVNLLGGTITGNTSDGDGAGVYANAKTQLTIKGAKLTDNVAAGYGGAIFATSNGTVITMDAGEMSGNVSNAGGAVMTQTRSKFVMNGGKISGNSDRKSGGGGLYISTNTEFVMNGGEISGNYSSANGGGFYALRSKVTLNGGVISGNEAKNRAGGMALSGAEAEINKITIKGNSANEGGAAYINRTSATSNGVTTYYPSTVTINDGAVITGNKATTNCGGILMANEGTVVTMVGGEITKNTAKNGGGLMTWSQSLFVMKGGKINNNTATGSGGGIYISTNTTFKLEGGQVNNNTAKSGGGIYFLRSTGVLSGGTVSNNYAKEEVKWTDGKETKSGGSAGGIYISGSTLDLKGTYITNNKADSNGGGIVMGRASYKENGVTKYALVKVNIYGGVVSGNYSGASAGGMLMQSEGTVVNMYGGTFTKNTSAKSGGGIYVSTKTTFNMTGGRVVENHAETTGGGIFAYKSTANISGGELNSNTSVTNGANLVASGGTAVVTIKNIKLYGGVSKTAGCLVVQTQGSILNVENCEIYDNQSTTGHGGAVFVSNKAFGNFTNCKFFDNQAAQSGGAVLVNNFANATFTGCEFYENSAKTQGGAVWSSVASNTTIEDSHFYKNTAGTRGGAITCRGNMLLKNSVVENNTAAEDGGGIYTDTNTTTGSGIMEGLKVEGSKIRNNTSGLQGGGFYIFKGCRVELYDTEITGNKSATEGGAIWAYEDLELHDTTITGNTSGGEGFAVYMNDANFDGHSYFTSRNKMSGNVIIKDNEGGDLWMGPDVVIAITADGMGSDTHIELTLDSGVVTNRIFGAFHYEGGNQVYTITSGDRSITDPEYDASLVGGSDEEEAKAATADVLLYVGIGIFALAVIAVVILLIAKKKKAGNTAEEATKE